MTSRIALLLPLVLLVACSSTPESSTPPADSGTDGASDGIADTRPDSSIDSSVDSAPDSTADSGSDTKADTKVDSGADTGEDVEPDTGGPPFDVGPPDTGFPPPPDAPPPDVGPPPDGGACNALVYAGPDVAVETSSGSPPTLLGGTIVDGTYALGKVVFYTTSLPLKTIRQTLQFSAGVAESISSVDGGSDGRSSSTFVTAGSSITITPTCGGGTGSTGTFQASATIVEMVFDSGGLKGYLRYDKK